MIQRLTKKTWLLLSAAIFTAITFLFISCQKEISGTGVIIPVGEKPDLVSKIQSSVSGFVTDENNAAVKDATVKIGTNTITTDKYGYFEIKNVSVVKNAALVTVSKAGYFNGIKTYIATEGKGAFFRIKLLPKTVAGNIDANAGGTVTLSNGMKVTLPAAAVVNAASNAAYSGQVNVAVQWIDPTAADLNRIMPGDLRGLNTDGYLKLLSTYGMCAVELSGGAGELLQVAGGKKATLDFPIPSSMAGSAPASIPLWYFDENVGLWKEQGSATKNGNNYTGEVSHFSYWNCDIPLDNSVTFDVTVKDANGNPIPSANVSVHYANGTYTGAHGLTDENGYIKGRIPGNAQLLINVITDYTCNGPAYSQNITTTTADIQLGTITIGANNTASVSGNVTDCNNNPVTDGYVLIQNGYYNYKAEVNADGTFSQDILICGGTTINAVIIAVDKTSQQQSTSLTQAITSSNNPVGTLNACGTSVAQFLNYAVDGTSYSIIAPGDSLTQFSETQSNPPSIIVSGYSISNGVFKSAGLSFSSTGIAVNSSQLLHSFQSSHLSDSVTIQAPINVTITEYGDIGQFIAGNFTGVFTGAPPANVQHNVSCSFRVRRIR